MQPSTVLKFIINYKHGVIIDTFNHSEAQKKHDDIQTED